MAVDAKCYMFLPAIITFLPKTVWIPWAQAKFLNEIK